MLSVTKVIQVSCDVCGKQEIVRRLDDLPKGWRANLGAEEWGDPAGLADVIDTDGLAVEIVCPDCYPETYIETMARIQ